MSLKWFTKRISDFVELLSLQFYEFYPKPTKSLPPKSGLNVPSFTDSSQKPDISVLPIQDRQDWPDWLPNWAELSKFKERKNTDELGLQKKKVLIASVAGGHPACVGLESLIGVALDLRGAEVDFLLCDGILPGCLQCSIEQFPDMENFVKKGPQGSLCNGCFSQGNQIFEATGLKIQKLSDYLNNEDLLECAAKAQKLNLLDELGPLLEGGIRIGNHIRAGVLRFFATGDYKNEKYGLQVLRRFAESAYLTKLAAERLMAQEKYDFVFMNHGIYVPHGLINEVAGLHGAETSVWYLAARSSCVHISHRDTAIFTMLNEPTQAWENMNWTSESESELLEYLDSRWTGAKDWLYAGMHKGSEADIKKLADEFNIDFSKPTVIMLTNVVWDAVLFYPDSVFSGQIEWILETIDYFKARPELNLVIRVHPAEDRDTMKSRQTAIGEITLRYPVLPTNVFVIPPGHRANTYALASASNSAIIYGTTTGMELTSMGIPTITAGEAFIKNKNITIDPFNKKEYFELLDTLPLKELQSADRTRRARMYAYHYYFRRSVPVSHAAPREGWPPISIKVADLEELLPGKDVGLDVICSGILENKDFIYPAEIEVIKSSNFLNGAR